MALEKNRELEHVDRQIYSFKSNPLRMKSPAPPPNPSGLRLCGRLLRWCAPQPTRLHEHPGHVVSPVSHDDPVALFVPLDSKSLRHLLDDRNSIFLIWCVCYYSDLACSGHPSGFHLSRESWSDIRDNRADRTLLERQSVKAVKSVIDSLSSTLLPSTPYLGLNMKIVGERE